MMQALTGARIFDGERILEGRSVLIRDGVIDVVAKDRDVPADVEKIDLGGDLLAPGFIDVQVNGGGGVLLNDQPDVEALKIISAAHRRYGTTSLLPTIISDDFTVMEAAARAVREAQANHVPGIIGVHFEGPYLNVKRKGAHDQNKIRPFEEKAMALFSDPDLGVVVVTLAPEMCPPRIIGRLRDAGVRVCAGHTAGGYEDMEAAIEQGLAGFTHLFNAMTPLSSRAPGVVGAALDDVNSWCGIIVDGHHVHPATLKVAIAAKTAGKMMLVTDAMPTVGASRKAFTLKGEEIQATNGICATADGTLAGSDLDMASAVRNTVELLDQPLEEALRMASLYPAEFLGIADRLGRIATNFEANLNLLDDGMVVKRTWIAGQMIAH